MHGGRQQYIDLTLEKNKINIRVEKSMYNYSKKYIKFLKRKKKNIENYYNSLIIIKDLL